MHAGTSVPPRGTAGDTGLSSPLSFADGYTVSFALHAALAQFQPPFLRRLLRERQRQASDALSSSSSPLSSFSPRQSPFQPFSSSKVESGGSEGGGSLRLQMQSSLLSLAEPRTRKQTGAGPVASQTQPENRDTVFPEYLQNVGAFLRACKESAATAAAAAQHGTDGDVLLVLGNTSADLDSISAAIGYAFFLEFCRFVFEPLSSSPDKTAARLPVSEPAARPRFLPVVQCRSREYAYRLQTRWWLELCTGEFGDATLLFVDTPATATLLAQAADSPTAPLLALVDHNAVEPSEAACIRTTVYRRVWGPHLVLSLHRSRDSPRGSNRQIETAVLPAGFGHPPLLTTLPERSGSPGCCRAVMCMEEDAQTENVVAMIDHHDVLPEARRSTVSAFAVDIPGPAVGSCCTLVSQLWQELSRITANLVEPPVALSCLLLGAVAVDTTACDTALFGIRWSSPDKEMQAALWGRAETFLGRNFSSPEAIVRAFGRIKFDIPRQLSLGLPALMRADYKSFVYSDVCGEDLKVGFGALTVPLSVILHVPGCRLRQREEAAGSTNLRGAFASAAATLIEEQNLGVVVGLSTYPRPADDGGGDVLERQMALIGKKALQYLIEGAIAYVTREVPSGVMVLKTVQDQQPTGCASSVLETLTDVFFVSQIPVKYSRKVLEPRFRQYFASLSRTHAP